MAHGAPHCGGDEAALLAAALAGDESAFGVLLERHRRGLECYCNLMLGDRHAAGDALADTAMMWLYRVAVRVCCEATGEPISFGSENRLTS